MTTGDQERLHDEDIVIRGDTYADLFYVNAPNDRIGIGTVTPTHLAFSSIKGVMASFSAGADVGSLIVSAPGHPPVTLDRETVLAVISELMRYAYVHPRSTAGQEP
jgi:hypothetical protein